MWFQKTACQSCSFNSYPLWPIYPMWGFMGMSGNIGTERNKAFHPISLQISSNSVRWLEQTTPRSLNQLPLWNLLDFRHVQCLTTRRCVKLKKTASGVSPASSVSQLPTPFATNTSLSYSSAFQLDFSYATWWDSDKAPLCDRGSEQSEIGLMSRFSWVVSPRSTDRLSRSIKLVLTLDMLHQNLLSIKKEKKSPQISQVIPIHTPG